MEVITAIKLILGLTSFKELTCILLFPFISTFIVIYTNNALLDGSDIVKCLICKVAMDYVKMVFDREVNRQCIERLIHSLKKRLRRVDYKCGNGLPGEMLKIIADLYHDESKLSEFIVMLPILYSSVISFSVMIYTMKADSEYPIRVIFSLFCIVMCALITYLTDSSVYEKTKPPANTIIKLNDPYYVKTKLSLGCIIDEDFAERKSVKINKQQKIQRWAIILINLIITYISMKTGNMAQLHSFGSISGMIALLADHIRSFQYSSFVIEYFSVCNNLAPLIYQSKNEVQSPKFDTVKFINTSFGYYSNIMTNPTKKTIISKFNYTFRRGQMYYLEAANAAGKSTFLRMFKSNLFGGKIMFGNTNRTNLSFETLIL